MAIHLKTADQIEKMYAAGQLVRRVLDRLGEIIVPGMTTKELDDEAARITRDAGAKCLFYGVPGRGGVPDYPGNICASINEEVVHGIPRDRQIRDGDIVSVDFGVLLDGWCGDAARTFEVGQVDDESRRLVSVTRGVLDIAIELTRPGGKWSTVAQAMQDFIQGEGFSVVREFVGHGIGQQMHEEPKVPNFLSPELRRRDIALKPGLVLAVEPMVNAGVYRCSVRDDGWTVITVDGKRSAHWEHTLAVTDAGVRVLTK